MDGQGVHESGRQKNCHQRDDRLGLHSDVLQKLKRLSNDRRSEDLCCNAVVKKNSFYVHAMQVKKNSFLSFEGLSMRCCRWTLACITTLALVVHGKDDFVRTHDLSRTLQVEAPVFDETEGLELRKTKDSANYAPIRTSLQSSSSSWSVEGHDDRGKGSPGAKHGGSMPMKTIILIVAGVVLAVCAVALAVFLYQNLDPNWLGSDPYNEVAFSEVEGLNQVHSPKAKSSWGKAAKRPKGEWHDVKRADLERQRITAEEREAFLAKEPVMFKAGQEQLAHLAAQGYKSDRSPVSPLAATDDI